MNQCPACSYELTMKEQAGNPDCCSACGVYFAKYLARKAMAARSPTKKSSARKSGDGTPAYIRDSLAPNETVEAVFRLHWIAWVPSILWSVATLITMGLLLPFAIFYWLKTRSIEQAVTSRRVVYKYGIISRRTEEMRVDAIETVELRQGVIGRILGFGNVRVTGRGSSDVVIQRVGDPIDVKRRIEQVRYNDGNLD